jgi:hypothetical protein
MSPRRPVWRRLGSGAAGLMVAASLFTACSAARSGQGTTDESCYLALPTTEDAVGGHAHLAGVRKFTLSGLHGVAPRLYAHLVTDVPKGQNVCVAAYTGHFSASTVSKPLGRPTGTLAVVVVTTPANHLLGTLILTKLPLRFQHVF